MVTYRIVYAWRDNNAHNGTFARLLFSFSLANSQYQPLLQFNFISDRPLNSLQFKYLPFLLNSPFCLGFTLHHPLMQPLFPTNRWHCGIRLTATFPTISSENNSKRWRSAAMDMRERAEAMENWNEGCRLYRKAYSVTKLLHKTTNISLETHHSRLRREKKTFKSA